jgi:hypothetical protein
MWLCSVDKTSDSEVCLWIESGYFEDETVCVNCGNIVVVVVVVNVVVVEFDIGQSEVVDSVGKQTQISKTSTTSKYLFKK